MDKAIKEPANYEAYVNDLLQDDAKNEEDDWANGTTENVVNNDREEDVIFLRYVHTDMMPRHLKRTAEKSKDNDADDEPIVIKQSRNRNWHPKPSTSTTLTNQLLANYKAQTKCLFSPQQSTSTTSKIQQPSKMQYKLYEKDMDGFLKPLPKSKAVSDTISYQKKIKSSVATAKFDSGIVAKKSSNESKVGLTVPDGFDQLHQITENQKNLNMKNFSRWLNEKSKINDEARPLLLKVLDHKNTKELLQLKITELRSDKFMMKNRTTEELYLVLVNVMMEFVREQWQKTERKYSSTLQFLEGLNSQDET